MERKWALLLSDIHCGSRFGLMLPGTELPSYDDEDEEGIYVPELTEWQKRTAQWYEQDLGLIADRVGNEPMMAFLCGDVSHGKKYADKELVSIRTADQLIVAEVVVSRLLELTGVKVLRVLKGTGSHVFGHGSAEVQLAALFKRRGIDSDCWYHADIEWAGVRFDVAHHGPSPGIRNWTQGRQLRYYLQSLATDDLMAGRTPAGIVIRGHYHNTRVEHLRLPSPTGPTWIWGVVCPSYSLADDYTRQATRSKRYVGVGMLLVEIIDGKVVAVHEDYVHTLDLARREVIDA